MAALASEQPSEEFDDQRREPAAWPTVRYLNWAYREASKESKKPSRKAKTKRRSETKPA